MKTFKRFLRLLALALMIALASVLPVPITFYKKDDLPKFLIEQLDHKEDEDGKEDIKEIF
jgi:hypothetical protein